MEVLTLILFRVFLIELGIILKYLQREFYIQNDSVDKFGCQTLGFNVKFKIPKSFFYYFFLLTY